MNIHDHDLNEYKQMSPKISPSTTDLDWNATYAALLQTSNGDLVNILTAVNEGQEIHEKEKIIEPVNETSLKN